MSALKVVATIETPINHQGAERPEVKNSTVLEPARLASSTAGKKEMAMDATTITQSSVVKCMVTVGLAGLSVSGSGSGGSGGHSGQVGFAFGSGDFWASAFSRSVTRRSNWGSCWMARSLPFPLAIGLGGVSEPLVAIGDVVHDPGLGGDDGAVADFEVAGEADLAGEGDVVAELGAAGDAGLGDDEAMLAEGDVMGDLDQVIDLGATPDDGGAERAPVDGHIGADLHVVHDDDLADLRDLAMDPAVEDITETVGANHGTGVNAHPPTELGAGVEDDIGEELGGLANEAMGADMIVAVQDHTRPDLDGVANHAMGAYACGGIDTGGGRR